MIGFDDRVRMIGSVVCCHGLGEVGEEGTAGLVDIEWRDCVLPPKSFLVRAGANLPVLHNLQVPTSW